MTKTVCRLLLLLFFILPNMGTAQVATGYTWSQIAGTYTPLVAPNGTTPAAIFPETWDDMNTTALTLPFAFYYNGVVYPAGTVVGIDTDGWIAFNPGTMTGNLGGGSWVSVSDPTGVYLNGTANNNGFAGFNADIHTRIFTDITGNLTNGSNTITSVSSTANVVVGTRLVHANIPFGAVATAVTATTITLSANATATVSNATINPRSSIFYQTIGTAPNRSVVVQWTQVRRFGTGFESTDNYSFQLRLNEGGNTGTNYGNQTLQAIYGTCNTTINTDLNFQVGLRGNTAADYNARTGTTTNWATTTAATANTQTVGLRNNRFPNTGRTFTWTPVCATMSAPGTISGSSPVCPNTVQAYSIAAVTGATYYIWSYSGTGATFTTTTATPSNSISFASNATSGTLTVTPANPCNSGTAATRAITITAVTNATITYPSGAGYCTSNAPVSVTQTGPTGGTYAAAPAGLTINPATGQITPASSTQGTYTVTYNYSSSGCPLTVTTAVTIKPVVSVSASATPSTVCGSGNAQLTANVNSGTGYVVSSIPHTALSGTATVLWNTYTDDAMSAAIPIPFAFNFYGAAATQLYVSTNGYIQIQTSTANSTLPQTLPDAATPNGVIALAWDDLIVDPTTNPGSAVQYFVSGTAPNRIMVLQYVNLRFLGGTGAQNVTGQIRLFESDSHIEVHATTVNDNGNNYLKTLGVENAAGSSGSAPAGRNNAAWNVTVSEAWSFAQSSVTYAWSPTTFLSSPSIYNPVATALNATTSYTVTVTNTATGCSGSSNVTVPFSNTQLLSSTGASRCGNGTVTLNATANAGNTIAWYNAASGGSNIATGSPFTTASLSASTTYYVAAEAWNAGGTAVAGSGATNPLDYSGIFYHLYGGAQTQFLIQASELYAAGLRPGNITSLGIRFASVSAQAYSTFTIGMMATANTDMSGGLNTGAFTPVYSAASVTPAAGINTYTLAPAFNWNGTSNVIIKMCWSNNNTGGTDNYAQVDATSFVSCAYYRADNQTPAVICAATTGTGTLSSRPQFYFGGTTASCATTRTAVTASINPQPAAMVTNPAAVTLCAGDPAQALTFTGGTYPSTSSVYAQGFENFAAAGFTVTGPMVAAATNTTYFAEGIRSVLISYTGTSATTTTSNNNLYSQSANINLSTVTNAQMTFKHICALEGPSTTYDAGHVQYSTDGGASWTTFPTASYAGSGTLMTTIGTGTIFSTRSYADWITQFSSSSSFPANALWKTETINIPVAAHTANFRIRFMITNDASVAYYGWLIDDIKISATGTVAAPVVWTPNGAGSGLYTDAAASIVYNGAAATTVYARPTATTTFTATATAPGGCTAANTTVVTVKPLNTWLGINTNWNDPVNWCPGVPTATSDVIIPNSVANYPVITINTPVARNITIQNAANITINSGGLLNVKGNLLNSGILTNNGTLSMNGTITQSFPGNAGTIAAMNILEIANTGAATAVQLDKNITVTGELKPTSGVFALGNFDVTIRSTTTATARVSSLGGTASFTYGTGRFVVERFVKSARKWRFLSIPTSTIQTVKAAWQEGALNQAANPVPGYGTQIPSLFPDWNLRGFDNVSAGGHSMKYWNEATQAYIGQPNTSSAIASDKGYMLFIRGDRTVIGTAAASATTMRTRGPLKTGAVTVNYPSLAINKFVSAGNPYASAIDMRNVNRTNLSDMFYVWDPVLGGSYNLGAFQLFTLNGTNYTVFPGGGSYAPANTIDNNIESGSAFYLKTQAAGTSSVSFNEASKTSGSRAVFRGGSFTNEARFMNFLETFDDGGNPFILDGVMIDFNDAYSNDVNGDDAPKLKNTGENISIAKAGGELILERRAMVSSADTIFLQLGNVKLRSYRFNFHTENMMVPGLEAWLVDAYTGVNTPLNLSSGAVYNFTVENIPGSYAANRFMIVFRQAVVLPVNIISITAARNNHQGIDVNWTTENEIQLDHYDVERSHDGSHFTAIKQQQPMNNGVRNNYLITDEQPLDGKNYYRVRATNDNGTTLMSKIVMVDALQKEHYIRLYPNPVTDQKIRLEFAGHEPGIYQAEIIAADGKLVYKTALYVLHGNAKYEINPNKLMAQGNYTIRLLLNEILLFQSKFTITR